jgi:hypothetical protein
MRSWYGPVSKFLGTPAEREFGGFRLDSARFARATAREGQGGTAIGAEGAPATRRLTTRSQLEVRAQSLHDPDGGVRSCSRTACSDKPLKPIGERRARRPTSPPPSLLRRVSGLGHLRPRGPWPARAPDRRGWLARRSRSLVAAAASENKLAVYLVDDVRPNGLRLEAVSALFDPSP